LSQKMVSRAEQIGGVTLSKISDALNVGV